MRTVINRSLLSLAVMILLTMAGNAQTGLPPGEKEPRPPRANVRRQLLRQLGLSPIQIRQIGQINSRRRPVMEAAQQRFRDANRRLDQAIYADQLNEVEVQDRVKEVQQSQSELIRLRSMSELSIRKLLTADQLIRFRRMRQRFDAGSVGRANGPRANVEISNLDPQQD